MHDRKIVVGTRGSQLALTQTRSFIHALQGSSRGLQIEERTMQTAGDLKQDTPRSQQSDKRDWIAELEEAVAAGQIDLAVHSGKDVPALIHPSTTLIPVLERESPFDAFVAGARSAADWRSLARGALIGTASVRRAAQLRRLRPDLQIVEHRGNVPTRLEKLAKSEALDGIVLAQAGLSRLSLSAHVSGVFLAEELLPTVNQGTLVVQIRENDSELRQSLKALCHPATVAAFLAERSGILGLQADCNSAVGMYAAVAGEELRLRGRVLSHDGRRCVEAERLGDYRRAAQWGEEVTNELLSKGAREILAEGKSLRAL